MKHLLYILTCLFTMLFFASAEGKPLAKHIQYNQNSFQQKFIKKDLSIFRNVISMAFIDADDDLGSKKDNGEGIGERVDDHFVFCSFGAIINFLPIFQFSKSVVFTEGFNHLANTSTIPLYILFQSLIIPSVN